jgi:hypothetical protein
MGPASQTTQRLGAPPALLAIIQAARLAGDRDLEQAARRELAEQHGIDVVFRRRRHRSRQEARHAE